MPLWTVSCNYEAQHNPIYKSPGLRCTQGDRRAGDRRPNNPPRSRDLPPDELEAPRPDQGQNCVASPDDSGEAVCVGGGKMVVVATMVDWWCSWIAYNCPGLCCCPWVLAASLISQYKRLRETQATVFMAM